LQAARSTQATKRNAMADFTTVSHNLGRGGPLNRRT
jgi:hypothetical protein